MTNEPRRRPEDDPHSVEDDQDLSTSSAGQPTSVDIWAAVEAQIDEIVRDEDEDDPTDPQHPDYDLSTASPYRPVEAQPRFWFTSRWVLILVAVVAITGMVLPYLQDIF